MMRVEDLINKLSGLDPEKEVVFYNLNDYDLESRELETILDFDGDNSEYRNGHIEITIKKIEYEFDEGN
jgi:hypothetical protein